jgi:hypothetical protein
MNKSMRKSTLETLGLGSVLDIFQRGQLPVDTDTLIDKIFGDKNNRGAIVISGAKGIVGAGKMMQLGVRLMDFGIPLVGLDMGGASDGLSFQYQGLVSSFGKTLADKIMSNVVISITMEKAYQSTFQHSNQSFYLKLSLKILN